MKTVKSKSWAPHTPQQFQKFLEDLPQNSPLVPPHLPERVGYLVARFSNLAYFSADAGYWRDVLATCGNKAIKTNPFFYNIRANNSLITDFLHDGILEASLRAIVFEMRKIGYTSDNGDIFPCQLHGYLDKNPEILKSIYKEISPLQFIPWQDKLPQFEEFLHIMGEIFCACGAKGHLFDINPELLPPPNKVYQTRQEVSNFLLFKEEDPVVNGFNNTFHNPLTVNRAVLSTETTLLNYLIKTYNFKYTQGTADTQSLIFKTFIESTAEAQALNDLSAPTVITPAGALDWLNLYEEYNLEWANTMANFGKTL